MAASRYLVDSNVLIRWVRRESAEYSVIVGAVSRLAESGSIPCYTSRNLGELWNVLTRPADRNGYGLTPAEADRRAREIESSLQLLKESPETHDVWRRLLVDHAVSGAQVHDARIVAAMHVHRVQRILTFNTRDFTRFPGIEAVHPSAAA